MWGMLHAVFAMVSARIACGLCTLFTIIAIWRMPDFLDELLVDNTVDDDDIADNVLKPVLLSAFFVCAFSLWFLSLFFNVNFSSQS